LKTQIFPGEFSAQDFYQLVIGSIGPRPIALISTQAKNGVNNLAPYSFFNVFSVQPLIVAFSTSLRSGNKKDTYRNVSETGECVINVVSGDIMHQMVICAADFTEDVDEFAKAGLTPAPSQLVTPPSVLQSKANLECKVNQIIELGNPITGYLVICDVVRMVVNDNVINANRINPDAMDLIGRMGRNFYSSTDANSRLELPRPLNYIPLGFDKLPDFLKHNDLLSGRELSYFANQESLKVGERPASLFDLELSEGVFIDRWIRPLLPHAVDEAFTLLFYFYNPSI
jgi:flavin reductase (DIM6/NTAB) family NADH-FMN oxidoreductase RutF